MNEPVEVSLVRHASYTDGLAGAVQRLLSRIGGIERFVQQGQTVLIKPNLLSDKRPEDAVTTHPELVRAVVRLVKQRGAECVVADSPANVLKTERVWEATGLRAVCEEEDVPLVNLERAGSVGFRVRGVSFSVARPVLDADVVISVPKVKTHVLTILTCGVKNVYGVIPGFLKTSLHRDYPTPSEFGRLLAAVYSKVRPHLTIADGILAMEGDGPSGGDPVALSLLAASEDAVALDRVLCRILNIDFEAVPTFRHLAAAGVGQMVWSRIKVVGDSLDAVKPKRFRVPGTLRGRMIPGWLVRFVGPHIWIRPAFSDRCISCGRCVKACPVGALSIEHTEQPLLDAERCIGCCCCHEVCPEHAVRMVHSPLLNLVRGGRTP